MFDSTWSLIHLFTWAALLSLALLLLILCSIMLQLRQKGESIPPAWSRGRLQLPTLEEIQEAEKATKGLYRARKAQERPEKPEVIVIGGKPERLKQP
jgi:hypothetical protein